MSQTQRMSAAEARALFAKPGKTPAKAPSVAQVAPTPPKPPTDTPEAKERVTEVKKQQSQDAALRPRYAVATTLQLAGFRFVASGLTESQKDLLCHAAAAAGILPQS